MIISLSDTQKDLPLKHDKAKFQTIVEIILEEFGQKFDEVSIFLVTETKIKKLHQQFFDDPSSTDCISLPMDDDDETGYKILGEVFICPKVAIAYAETHESDPYLEVTLYLVHGILHLLGYDDIAANDRKTMRAQEKKFMKILKDKRCLLSAPRKRPPS